MQTAWRVGNLLGIPFYIDYSWIPIAILIALSFTQGLANQFEDLSQLTVTVGGILLATGLFGSVLAHELAHSLVALAQGVKVKSITLFVFGGVAALEREASTARGAFWVAAAGPTFNITFFCFLVLLLESGWIPDQSLPYVVLQSLAGINISLALFNLLPGLPLDGGQMLKAVVWGVSGDARMGIRWASRSGQVVGYTLMALAVYSLLQGSIFGGIWLFLIGLFVLNNARNYSQYLKLQSSLTSLRARDVMTRQYRVVDSQMTLRDFVDQYLLSLEQNESAESSENSTHPLPDVYFAEADGRYKGLIKQDRVRSIERSHWDQRTVSDILQPMEEIEGLPEDTSIKDVILLMQRHHELRQVVVWTPAGSVAGLIDKGDIVAGLAKAMGLLLVPEILNQIRERNEFPPGFRIDDLDPSLAADIKRSGDDPEKIGPE